MTYLPHHNFGSFVYSNYYRADDIIDEHFHPAPEHKIKWSQKHFKKVIWWIESPK